MPPQRKDKDTQNTILSDETKIVETVKNYYIIQAALAKARVSVLYKTPKAKFNS